MVDAHLFFSYQYCTCCDVLLDEYYYCTVSSSGNNGGKEDAAVSVDGVRLPRASIFRFI